MHETAARGEFATGVLYIEPDKDDLLTPAQHRRRAARDAAARPRPPGRDVLDAVMEEHR